MPPIEGTTSAATAVATAKTSCEKLTFDGILKELIGSGRDRALLLKMFVKSAQLKETWLMDKDNINYVDCPDGRVLLFILNAALAKIDADAMVPTTLKIWQRAQYRILMSDVGIFGDLIRYQISDVVRVALPNMLRDGLWDAYEKERRAQQARWKENGKARAAMTYRWQPRTS